MGLLTAAMRMSYLKASQSDLEYKIQLVSKAKLDISTQTTELVNAGTDLNPNSPIVKQLEARRERLHLMEKQLDQQMLGYQNRLKLVEAEYKSCAQMFDKNVSSVQY